MEQWHQARAQCTPDSPTSSSDTMRQVVISHLEGMECGDANTLHLDLVFLRSDASSHLVIDVT